MRDGIYDEVKNMTDELFPIELFLTYSLDLIAKTFYLKEVMLMAKGRVEINAEAYANLASDCVISVQVSVRMLTLGLSLIQLQLHQRLASVAQCVHRCVRGLPVRFGGISRGGQYGRGVYL